MMAISSDKVYPWWLRALKWNTSIILGGLAFQHVINPIVKQSTGVLGDWLLDAAHGKTPPCFYNVNDLFPPVREQFAGYNILLLGREMCGKVELLKFMQHGRMFSRSSMKDLRGFALIGRSSNARSGSDNQEQTAASDNVLRTMISKVEPDGLIYVIDGHDGRPDIDAEIDGLSSQILQQYQNDRNVLRRPLVLQIIWHFCLEARAPEMLRVKRYTEDLLREKIAALTILSDMTLDVCTLKLAAMETGPREIQRVIDQFGAYLRNGG